MTDEQPRKLLVTLFICLLVSLPLITLISALFLNDPEPQQSNFEESQSLRSSSFMTRARDWLHIDDEYSLQVIQNDALVLDVASAVYQKTSTAGSRQLPLIDSPAQPSYPLDPH